MTTNKTVATDKIYLVDAASAITGKDYGGNTDFGDLFATSGKAFNTTVSGGNEKAVIAVKGNDVTQIYYVEATNTTLDNTMVTLVATLDSNTALTADNFA